MNVNNLYLKRGKVYDFELPKSIVVWILTYIDRPIRGYEHKTNEKGEVITLKEQLSETKFQIMLIAADYYKRGFSEVKIRRVLSAYFLQSSRSYSTKSTKNCD